ncbi:hypothetical protein Igag_0308 [Ignisphaera aggregans DSM 17230]|uniref:Uncharacterized protein n=1 Tax=Ignisphaera aggregans (strain DSM 17230 / JCM 13409 / AQ1.S1) TaxID=583356 RepID=E0SQT0_IGNAA|nr:hypothetical protein Igag_0308 [Ignisphaera aggregans DSM 17230]
MSIAIAVLAYIANLLNPLVMLCVAALTVQSIAILVRIFKYSRSMPYTRFMRFLEFLTAAVVIIGLWIVILSGSPDVRFTSLLVALGLTMLAIGKASIEAPKLDIPIKKIKIKITSKRQGCRDKRTNIMHSSVLFGNGTRAYLICVGATCDVLSNCF